MRKTMFAFAFLGLSICVSGGEYFIEINPSAESGFYEINVGDIVTFEVTAYKRDDDTTTSVNLNEKIWWQYSKRLFEKVSSSENSIRLKAIRESATQLGATTIIKNNHCQKKINIAIIK